MSHEPYDALIILGGDLENHPLRETFSQRRTIVLYVGEGPRRRDHRVEWIQATEPQRWEETLALSRALADRGLHAPLLWIADARFALLAARMSAAYRVLALEHFDADNVVHQQLLNGADFTFEVERGLTPKSTNESESRPNILVLYSDVSLFTNTVLEHLTSMSLFTWANVYYAPATHQAETHFDLEYFDVVIIHYSVRLTFTDYLCEAHATALRQYLGVKVLFLQDEYEATELTRTWIAKLGIHLLFTCVPPESFDTVYPASRFPWMEIHRVLTGYVPAALEIERTTRPIGERELRIVHRGRPLDFWYGDLGWEKLIIGQQMRAACERRGIHVDIDWTKESRIYGDAWYTFLESGRATLGSESGSNVFDEHGLIASTIRAALLAEPDLTYLEARRRFLEPHEGRVKMNQISPRVFEAMACRTALILFEGEYSGVVIPNVHYIPLKKDLSNVDEVLAKLEDVPALEQLTERAFRDIVASGRYSYRAFAEEVGDVIRRRLRHATPEHLLVGVVGVADPRATILAKIDPASSATSTPIAARRVEGQRGALDGHSLKLRAKNMYRDTLRSVSEQFAKNTGRNPAEVHAQFRAVLLKLRGKEPGRS